MQLNFEIKQECIPVGCVPALIDRMPVGGVCSGGWVSALGGGCLLWGGCLLRGGLLQGVSAPGGSALRGGVCSQGGLLQREGLLLGVVSQHALRQTPPPVDRITDMIKNITLVTTSLRLVKREISSECRVPHTRGAKPCKLHEIVKHFGLKGAREHVCDSKVSQW